MKTTIDAVIQTQRTQRGWREGGRKRGRKRKGGGLLKCKLCCKIGVLSQSATSYSAYPSYTVTNYFTDVCTIVTMHPNNQLGKNVSHRQNRALLVPSGATFMC